MLRFLRSHLSLGVAITCNVILVALIASLARPEQVAPLFIMCLAALLIIVMLSILIFMLFHIDDRDDRLKFEVLCAYVASSITAVLQGWLYREIALYIPSQLQLILQAECMVLAIICVSIVACCGIYVWRVIRRRY